MVELIRDLHGTYCQERCFLYNVEKIITITLIGSSNVLKAKKGTFISFSVLNNVVSFFQYTVLNRAFVTAYNIIKQETILKYYECDVSGWMEII